MDTNLIKYLIAPVVVIVLSIFAIFQFIFPLWSDIQVVAAKRDDLGLQAEFKEKLAKNLENLAAQYKSRKTDIDLISQIAPSNQDFPSILVMLEAIASETGLVFRDVAFAKEAVSLGTKKALHSSLVTLRVSGSYPNFKNYLKTIETNLRIFDVESVSFSSLAQPTAQAVSGIDFNVTLNIYYQ